MTKSEWTRRACYDILQNLPRLVHVHFIQKFDVWNFVNATLSLRTDTVGVIWGYPFMGRIELWFKQHVFSYISKGYG